MLYSLLKIPAKLALLIWCRHLRINKKEILNADGPLLIAANHPNSFLDAVLLCTIFKRPVYSLARGDAFTNKLFGKILRSLKMFPVYRISEGKENLEENYNTFDECINIFKKNGIVLIFSEGLCVNEWKLRPLMKGTARLALSAWGQEIDLKVLPLGINYISFRRFGKSVILNFGSIMKMNDFSFNENNNSGEKIRSINIALKDQFQNLVIQTKDPNSKKMSWLFEKKEFVLKRILLFIPACCGYILNAPLYIPIQKFAYKKFGRIGHYNSVLVGMLFLCYPFYLTLISLLVYFLFGSWWCICVFLLIPFTAWSLIQLKHRV